MYVPPVHRLPLIYMGISVVLGLLVGLTSSFFAILDRQIKPEPAEAQDQ